MKRRSNDSKKHEPKTHHTNDTKTTEQKETTMNTTNNSHNGNHNNHVHNHSAVHAAEAAPEISATEQEFFDLVLAPNPQEQAAFAQMLPIAQALDPKDIAQVNLDPGAIVFVERNPSSTFARLYLGHQLFDVGRYVEAAREFSQLRLEKFREIDQEWRELKTQELMLCCRLYLDPTSVSVDEVEKYCLSVARGDQSTAPPTELLVCLEGLARNQATVSVARQLIEPCIPRLRGSPRALSFRPRLDDVESAIRSN